MTRAKISEYSATAGDNTDVNGVNIAEGCPPSGINDAIREVMGALKRFETGSDGDSITVGGNLVVSGSTTANTLSTTVLQSDTISEKTSAAGVTVDGVLLKDSGVVTGAGTVSAPVYSTTGDTNTGIFFPAADTIAFAEGGAEAMRIDSSGNVGIGTSSTISQAATTNLQVYGTTNANLRLQSATTGVTGADGLLLQSSAGEGYIWNLENNFISFGTNNAERARITGGGDLLVGTTTAGSGALHVVKSTTAISTITSNSNSANLLTDGITDSYPCYFLNSGTAVGFIRIFASSTQYATSSDYRLKENVAPMTGALAKVAQLKPCTYTWKADGSAGQGFIAHELAEVCPEAVSGEKDETHIQQVEVSPAVPATYDDDGNELTPAVEAVYEEREVPKYQGVDTSFLVATLTAAIQELKAITDTQAQTISALEARIAALEN